MILKLKYPLTLIVAGTSICEKCTFVIRLLECWEKICDFPFEIMVWYHSERNAPHHLNSISFVKGVPDFENTKNIPTPMVFDDLMDSSNFTKESLLFTKRSRNRNISLIRITQNLFHQDNSSLDISLNSKYIVVCKIPRDKIQIVHLARKVYTEHISSFHKTYLEVCKDTHTYLFLGLTQSINDLLRFRTKIFPCEITELFAPVRGNEPVAVAATLPSRT